MGTYISRFYHRKDRKILLLGNSNTGKTSFLCTLQKLTKKPPFNKLHSPTIGFNTEIINFNDKNLLIWDLGGSENIRIYWHCYYVNVRAVLYFFDSSDFDNSCNIIDQIMIEMKCFYIIVVMKEDERVRGKYESKCAVMECGLFDAFAAKEILITLTNAI